MTSESTADEQLLRGFSEALETWSPSAEMVTLCEEYRSFVRVQGASAVRRELSRAHLTASAFVFTPDLASVLLCLHRKGNFWVQLGGHIEQGDTSIEAAALREAHEEGGIRALRAVGSGPLDLDRHDLAAGFVDCDTHWDVGFGFVASAGSVPRASAESKAVEWWPIDALPSDVPPGFVDRVRRAAGCLRGGAF